ncbi:MAG: RecX family transcriptional regulator [Dysgonamonadaceae bacterium]|jgi:regulatory protein|nr:RecX family transcriptional regulator [Dysgonamonadaceae bacterium]
MKPITYEQAIHRLAALCSQRERCIQDICQKLTLWKFSEKDQKKIIQYLQNERFLDEKRFSKAYANDKFKYNQWGIYKIKYELKKKQIPDHLIMDALAQIDSKENRKQLRQLLESKRKTIKGKNECEINQKLIRFANSRGFPLEDIEAVISSSY